MIFDWVRHQEFLIIGCWMHLYHSKYSLPLFWHAVKLLGNSLILCIFAFENFKWDQSSTIPHYWGKMIPSTLPSAPWMMRFSSLSGDNKNYLQTCMTNGCCFLQSFQELFLLVLGDFFTGTQWMIQWDSTDLWGSSCVVSPLWYSLLKALIALLSPES